MTIEEKLEATCETVRFEIGGNRLLVPPERVDLWAELVEEAVASLQWLGFEDRTFLCWAHEPADWGVETPDIEGYLELDARHDSPGGHYLELIRRTAELGVEGHLEEVRRREAEVAARPEEKAVILDAYLGRCYQELHLGASDL